MQNENQVDILQVNNSLIYVNRFDIQYMLCNNLIIWKFNNLLFLIRFVKRFLKDDMMIKVINNIIYYENYKEEQFL